MIDLRTGKAFDAPSAQDALKCITRRKTLAGLAGILATACAPSIGTAASGARRGLGMRCGMMAGSGGPTPTENPYAEDNLIAMWDGIWNVGVGTHDSSSTVWKDLSGSGYDVYTNDDGCNGVFTNNGLMCNGVDLAARGTLNNILPFNTNAEIETVVTFTSTVTTTSNFTMFYFHGGGQGSNDSRYPTASRNVLWIDTRAQYSRFGTAFIGGGYAIYRFNSNIAAGAHSIRYPQCPYTQTSLDNSKRPLVDNIAMSTHISAYGGSAWVGGGYRITMGGAQAENGTILQQSNNGFVINAIRWYSSALTSAQRTKHWNADKERFGLT